MPFCVPRGVKRKERNGTNLPPYNYVLWRLNIKFCRIVTELITSYTFMSVCLELKH